MDLGTVAKETNTASAGEEQGLKCTGVNVKGDSVEIASSGHRPSANERLVTLGDDESPEKPSTAARGDASGPEHSEEAKHLQESPAPSGDNLITEPVKAKPIPSEDDETTRETPVPLEGRQQARRSNTSSANEHLSPSERNERTEDGSKPVVRPKDTPRQGVQLRGREAQRNLSIARRQLKLTTGHGDYSTRQGLQLKQESSDQLTSDGCISPEAGSVVSNGSGTPSACERLAHVQASVEVLQSDEARRRLPVRETITASKETLPHLEGSTFVKPCSSHEVLRSFNSKPVTLVETEANNELDDDIVATANNAGSPIAKETLHFVLRRACCVSLSASVYGDDDHYDDGYCIKYTRAVDDQEQRETAFPKTLEEFGYYFNEEGHLRSVDGNERFNFRVKEDDADYSQKRYKAFEKVINESMCKLLKQRACLENVTLPTEAVNDVSKDSFFVSSRALEKETLLLLINANSRVRPGQWTSRNSLTNGHYFCSDRLITTNVFNKGSQLPYIEFGQKQGYGVLVLSITMNRDTENAKTWRQLICGYESPEDYALCVWDNFIDKSKAKHIAVVAHSYGAIVTSRLSDKREEFRRRVFAIAFIDSIQPPDGLSKQTKHLFARHAVNWVRSNKPADTELGVFEDLNCRSAGHSMREWTSYSAKDSIFNYILDKHKKALDQPQMVNRQKLCTCI